MTGAARSKVAFCIFQRALIHNMMNQVTSLRSLYLIVGLLSASCGSVCSLTTSSVNRKNPTRSLVRPSTEISSPNHSNSGAVSCLGRSRCLSSTALSVAASISTTSGDELFSSVSNSNQYLRWSKDDETYKLQTAVTTFRRRKQRQDGTNSATLTNGVYSDDDYETVELHAQLHFGDPEYFEYFNSSPEFVNQHDAVHYELLVDETLLETKVNTRQVKSAIMASPNDQSLARDYGKQTTRKCIREESTRFAPITHYYFFSTLSYFV